MFLVLLCVQTEVTRDESNNKKKKQKVFSKIPKRGPTFPRLTYIARITAIGMKKEERNIKVSTLLTLFLLCESCRGSVKRTQENIMKRKNLQKKLSD